MSRPRPRRAIIKKAIELSRQARGEHLIPSCEDGISVDAVFLFIMITNRAREALEKSHRPYDLHEIVTEVTIRSNLDAARAYAYRVVVMRYYSLLSQVRAATRHRLALRHERRANKSLAKSVSTFELIP